MEFPEMFFTGIVPESKSRLDLINNALLAWECANFIEAPNMFGTTMARIGTILGSDMWPENLNALLEGGDEMIVEAYLN